MEKNDKIIVESMADCTIIIDEPEYHFRREWPRKGSKFPIDRETLEQMFYERGVAVMFYEGYLKTDDKDFLRNVGMLKEDDTPYVLNMDDKLLTRMTKVMPLQEFKETLAKMSPTQIREYVDYAIEHHNDLKMDRIDLLEKMTGKNILKAIEFVKEEEKDQEGQNG